jgi:peptidoglycan-N-acetylglucosamine deacetylase
VTPDTGASIVVRGPSDRNRIALTFDDGPSPCTSELLDLLTERAVRATFFMVGSQLELEPEIGRRVLEAGHEVGAHSMRHLDHAQCGRGDAVADVVEGAEAIERVLGVSPRLYRAPYGHFVPVTLAEAERRGWTSVLWSACGEDWRPGEDGASIAARLLEHVGAGAIVLMHDGRREKPVDCERMLGALDAVLDEAAARGLQPVTAGELLGVSA